MGIYDVVHTPFGDVPSTTFSAGMTQQDVYAAQSAAGMVQGQTLLPVVTQDPTTGQYTVAKNTFNVFQDNRQIASAVNITESANPIVPPVPKLDILVPKTTTGQIPIGNFIGASTMTYNGSYTNTGLTTTSNPLGFLGDMFKVTNAGIGLNLPTLAMAYGAYRLFKYKKRAGLLGIGALAYGLYGTGILGSLFPKGSDNKTNATNVILGLAAPQLALAGVWGIGVPLIGSLIKMAVSRRSSSRRRSYRRTYYVNRRSYRMR